MSDDLLTFYCITCWSELAPVLARAGATKCHDCRDGLGSGNHPHPRLRSDTVEAPSPVVAAANTAPIQVAA